MPLWEKREFPPQDLENTLISPCLYAPVRWLSSGKGHPYPFCIYYPQLQSYLVHPSSSLYDDQVSELNLFPSPKWKVLTTSVVLETVGLSLRLFHHIVVIIRGLYWGLNNNSCKMLSTALAPTKHPTLVNQSAWYCVQHIKLLDK
jgi:hypothetical protein